mmetsp:Transcript_550/g.806  ORF Transcript_550/g.806 Transcript_550/m.806 type:complete len:89 (-) Transcript_550:158-424(-)
MGVPLMIKLGMQMIHVATKTLSMSLRNMLLLGKIIAGFSVLLDGMMSYFLVDNTRMKMGYMPPSEHEDIHSDMFQIHVYVYAQDSSSA